MEVNWGRGKIYNRHGEYVDEISYDIYSCSSFEIVIDRFNIRDTSPLKHTE